MKEKKVIPKKVGQKKKIPIEWHIPDGLISPFASNMLVQTIENEFKLLFFEIKPPLLLDDSTPFPEKARADCVASVIVTADRMPTFIAALQTQLNKYHQSKKQPE
jgi:hypothetical protein